MNELDQRLLDTINGINELSTEPRAYGEPDPLNDRDTDSDEEVSSIHSDASTYLDTPKLFTANEKNQLSGPVNHIITPWQRHGGPQTGPKGVLADYKWYQKHATMEYNTEDLELVDPEVLERYSLSRIKEWLSPPRPIFGKFREIHVSQFVKEIDSAHPHTPIIIHLFHRSHAACILLNQHFTLLAKKYKLAHFLRLVAKDADPEFDPIAFPTVQVYKNGRLICNLIRVTMELAREDEVWELYDCELMLRKHGALTDSDFSSGISANSDDSDSNT